MITHGLLKILALNRGAIGASKNHSDAACTEKTQPHLEIVSACAMLKIAIDFGNLGKADMTGLHAGKNRKAAARRGRDKFPPHVV